MNFCPRPKANLSSTFRNFKLVAHFPMTLHAVCVRPDRKPRLLVFKYVYLLTTVMALTTSYLVVVVILGLLGLVIVVGAIYCIVIDWLHIKTLRPWNGPTVNPRRPDLGACDTGSRGVTGTAARKSKCVYVPVICIPGSRRTGNNGDTAGLKCRDLSS